MARTKENLSFLDNVDNTKLDSLIENTNKNVEMFDKTCIEVVKKYSESLDNLMLDLYEECIKPQDVLTPILEKYFIELANLLYFMGEKLEKLGVYADMSKSAAKEVYSKNYLDNQVKENITGKNKTTVAELTAQAELAAQYDFVVNNIYDRAYSIMKYKINAAQDMLSALKKILSGRQAEINYTIYNKNIKIEGE